MVSSPWTKVLECGQSPTFGDSFGANFSDELTHLDDSSWRELLKLFGATARLLGVISGNGLATFSTFSITSVDVERRSIQGFLPRRGTRCLIQP